MPAAAVIPAPVAYIKVVAVKKLVVGCLAWWFLRLGSGHCALFVAGPPVIFGVWVGGGSFTRLVVTSHTSFTLKKLECLKQAVMLLNILAWNNKIGLWFYFVGSWKAKVMIDRDSWGC